VEATLKHALLLRKSSAVSSVEPSTQWKSQASAPLLESQASNVACVFSTLLRVE
jgi:hypothetical protein